MSMRELAEHTTEQSGRIDLLTSKNIDATTARTIKKLAADITSSQQQILEEIETLENNKQESPTSKDFGFCRVEKNDDKTKVIFKGKAGIGVGVGIGIAIGGIGVFLANRFCR